MIVDEANKDKTESSIQIISKDEDANTITVDGGEWSDGSSETGTDQSDIWSNYWNKPIATAERSFNNDISQQGSHFGTGVAGPVIWNPPNITFTDKVEVYFHGNSSKVKYNNEPSFTDITQQTWTTIASGGGTLEQVVIDRDVDPVYGWAAIRVDDLVLKDADGQTKLVKETPYDTKLTVASDKDLADMSGSVFGCSDAYGDGPFTQTPYKLVTSDIESVVEDQQITVTQGPGFTWTNNVSNDPFSDASKINLTH